MTYYGECSGTLSVFYAILIIVDKEFREKQVNLSCVSLKDLQHENKYAENNKKKEWIIIWLLCIY